MPHLDMSVCLYDAVLATDRLRRPLSLSYTKQAKGLAYSFAYKQNEILHSMVETRKSFGETASRIGLTDQMYSDMIQLVERMVMEGSVPDTIDAVSESKVRMVRTFGDDYKFASHDTRDSISVSVQDFTANVNDNIGYLQDEIQMGVRGLSEMIVMSGLTMDRSDEQKVIEIIRHFQASGDDKQGVKDLAILVIAKYSEAISVLTNVWTLLDGSINDQGIIVDQFTYSENAENEGASQFTISKADNKENESFIVNNTIVTVNEVNDAIFNFIEMMKKEGSDNVAQYFETLKKFIKEPAVESVIYELLKDADRGGKIVFNNKEHLMFSRGQVTSFINRRWIRGDKYGRTGRVTKPFSFAIRGGKDGKVVKRYTYAVGGDRKIVKIERLKSFASKYSREARAIDNDILFTTKDERNARNIEEVKYAARDIFDTFLHKITQCDKALRPARRVYHVTFAILKNREFTPKKFMIWPATIEQKQTWFYRELGRGGLMMEVMQKGSNKLFKPSDVGEGIEGGNKTERESVQLDNILDLEKGDSKVGLIFVEVDGAINSEKIAELSAFLKEFDNGDLESVLITLVHKGEGTIEGEVHPPEATVVFAEPADGKGAHDTVINLLSTGYPKDGKATDEIITLKLVDKGEIVEPIMSLLELAIRADEQSEAILQDIKEMALRPDKITDSLNLVLAGIASLKDKEAIKTLLRASAEVKKKEARYEVMRSAVWETTWQNLLDVKQKDKRDRLKVPNDDFNYKEYAEKNVYDPDTGVPKKAVGPTNKAEVKVQFPTEHFNQGYADLERQEIQVNMYLFRDVMQLIWIFWCKHKVDEDIADVLKVWYETENLDQTRMLEYSRIVSMTAPKALNYILDKVNLWINDSISLFAPDLVPEYQRILRFVRWMGEKIAMQLCEYTLVREYDPWIPEIVNNNYGSSVTATKVQLTSGFIENLGDNAKLTYTALTNYIDGDFSFAVQMTDVAIPGAPQTQTVLNTYLDGELKYTITTPGLYNGYNDTVLPTFTVPAGTHKIEFEFKGGTKCKILSAKLTGVEFVEARTKYEAKAKTGTLAVDKLLRMMYDYYEIHHEDKAKGERQMWMKS